jgi:hypothetical protein
VKKSLLDDLARTVATPMPRRQALRTIGAALAMGAFRMLRPGPATGYASQPTPCPPVPDPCAASGQIACCVTMGPYNSRHMAGCYNPATEICCVGGNGSPPPMDRMSWICPKGSTCPGTFNPNSKCSRPCTDDEIVCGKACCQPGQFCGSPNRGICCNAGENVCVYPKGGTCCKRGTSCCFTTSSAKCCDNLTETCVNGSCTCKNPKLKCGTDCCAKAGLCCVMAAGNRCCKPDEFCATILGAPGNKNCCPKDRVVVTKSGAPVCCPSGSVDNGAGECCPPGNPDCCEVGGLKTVCPKGTVCSLGSCVTI